MARNTTTAWATMPNRNMLDDTIQRLIANGFARSSIEVDYRGDGKFDLWVHTTEQNLPRVEKLMHPSTTLYALRNVKSGVTRTLTENPWAGAAALAVLGFAAISMLTRRGGGVSSLRELPRTIRDLPVDQWVDTVQETAAGMAESLQETVQDAIGAMPENIRAPAQAASAAVAEAASKIVNLGGVRQDQSGNQGQGQPQGSAQGQPQGQGHPQGQEPSTGAQRGMGGPQPIPGAPSNQGTEPSGQVPNKGTQPSGTASTDLPISTSPTGASATTPPQSTGNSLKQE